MEDGEPGPRQGVGFQLRYRLLDGRHGVDDIGAGFALSIERHRRLAEYADIGARLLMREGHGRDVADDHPPEPAAVIVANAAQHHLFDLAGLHELALGAHDVTAFAFLDIARGGRDVGASQGVDHLGHGQAVARHAIRVDGDLQLALAAAIHVDPGDALHPLQPILHRVLDEITEGVDRAIIAVGALDDEPGDRVVLGARRAEGRLIGLIRIGGDPVQPIGDQEEGAIHILADLELECDAAAAILGARRHLLDALQAAQHLFLLVDDLALDLCGGGTRPAGSDGNDRLSNVGRELDRDSVERDEPKQQRHQHRSDDGDRTLDGYPNKIHPWNAHMWNVHIIDF